MATGANLALIISAQDKTRGALDSAQRGIGGFGKFAIAALAGIAVAAAGVGAALLKVGMDVDDAYDTIRIGTGATGANLEELKGSFKEVFKSVPVDARQASIAIADLNTRLGLTGKPLEILSTQLLNLARITKQDVGGMTESVTRVFGDWSIATKDQSKAMDTLFKVSQATGISITKLGEQVVFYGAPLRQFGFSFEEAAVIMGKWNKEGVNAELVLGSLRIALGNFARDNIDARKGLEGVVAKIKELGPSAAATALAMETFGARAGADMVAAILEGRLSIEDLVKTITESEETINKAAKETEDWKESLKLLKNNVMLLIEPLATKLFGALSSVTSGMVESLKEGGALRGILDGIGSAATTLWDNTADFRKDVGALFGKAFEIGGDAFGQIKNIVNTFTGAMKGEWKPGEGIDPASLAFGNFALILKNNVIPEVQNAWKELGKLIEQIGKSDAVLTLVSWLGNVGQAAESLANIIRDNLIVELKKLMPVPPEVAANLDTLNKSTETAGLTTKTQTEKMRDAYIDLHKSVLPLIEEMGTNIGAFIDDVSKAWENAGPNLKKALDVALLDRLSSGVESAKAIWQSLTGGGGKTNFLQEALVNALNATKEAIGLPLTLITGIFTAELNLIGGNWDKAWSGLEKTAKDALDHIKGFIKALFPDLQKLIDLINQITGRTPIKAEPGGGVPTFPGAGGGVGASFFGFGTMPTHEMPEIVWTGGKSAHVSGEVTININATGDIPSDVKDDIKAAVFEAIQGALA